MEVRESRSTPSDPLTSTQQPSRLMDIRQVRNFSRHQLGKALLMFRCEIDIMACIYAAIHV